MRNSIPARRVACSSPSSKSWPTAVRRGSNRLSRESPLPDDTGKALVLRVRPGHRLAGDRLHPVRDLHVGARVRPTPRDGYGRRGSRRRHHHHDLGRRRPGGQHCRLDRPSLHLAGVHHARRRHARPCLPRRSWPVGQPVRVQRRLRLRHPARLPLPRSALPLRAIGFIPVGVALFLLGYAWTLPQEIDPLVPRSTTRR